ncbi:Protein of unknown function [Propionibacterium freudenreichii]|nr:Protein of unknown function [Propionibacterium freudenreichii subsp. freudenreichii]CEH10415.1 Protein of unknown function [Propionibacterium freudenreichii]
MRFGDQDES